MEGQSTAEALDQDSLAGRIVSFRAMPSFNLVYAVLSLDMHATSARIIRPQKQHARDILAMLKVSP